MLVLDHIKHISDLFFEGNYLYICLFLFSLIILAVRGRKQAGRESSLLLFSFLALLFIYFPVTSIFFDKFLNGDPVFARLWIICPIWIVISFVLANCFIKISNRIVKTLAITTLTVLLIAVGSNVRSLTMINEPNNIYKIRSEAVDVSEAVLKLNNGEPTSLFILVPVYTGPENYVEGGTVGSGIEQYTALIDLTSFGCSDEFWNDFFLSDITPTDRESEEWLNAFVNERQVASGAEYFAFPTNDIVNQRLISIGYNWKSDVGGYSIYEI